MGSEEDAPPALGHHRHVGIPQITARVACQPTPSLSGLDHTLGRAAPWGPRGAAWPNPDAWRLTSSRAETIEECTILSELSSLFAKPEH